MHTAQSGGLKTLKREGGMASVSAVWAVFSFCIWPAMGLTQPADALGTLMYTPVQRQAIGQARLGIFEGATAPVRSSRTRLDGVVARARGRGTAWVNGEPVAQGTNPSTRIQGTEAIVEGHRLRVGQSFDKSTGVKSDVVAPGAVRQGSQP
jgi:hypothetical protein